MHKSKIAVYSGLGIELTKVLNLVEDQDWIEAKVGVMKLDTNVRDASIKKLKDIQETIFPELQNYVADYTNEDLVMNSFALVRYTEGQFFKEHSDGGEGVHRKLSIVIYLNDDYEGGEIYFRNQNLTMKPRANSLVMFPSTEEFVHESKPIISGTKYAIISFWG